MIKYCLTAITLSFFSVFGQGKIHPALAEEIQRGSASDLVKIRIEMSQQVDVLGLKQNLKNAGISVDRIALEVIQTLNSVASNSQSEVISFLKSEEIKAYRIEPYWIVNVVFCEIEKSKVSMLESFHEIERICLENNRIQFDAPHEKSNAPRDKSLGGTELGLEAINVRPLWDLGYTGRGRTAFIYDTGVWPTHPAFSDRYLGNFKNEYQSWFGYYILEPNGERSSHGTHVLGTVMGLERATNDTIGVAMNAYWMANDHVGSTIAVMPDLSNLMAVYEWAMNPDGDLSTVDDIPDAINNSFRWYDGADTEQCEGLVRDLMINIEAVGIANVYSGGNFGPSNTTISAPQRINVTPVNTFSVGSINANVAQPFPLSNFSSIGPKQCSGDETLVKHPEVVAPGQNIRSAWGANSYNTISGTSMASPHVTGAVLLLKEAFPYLSGEDLLWALYLTAQDMGETGEDNLFGKGLIDAHAAFLFLSQTHTPVDPSAITTDLSVKAIQGINSEGINCTSTVHPVALVKNEGSVAINSFDYSFGGIGILEGQGTWSGTLQPGEEVNVDLGDLAIGYSGRQDFWFEVSLDNPENEYDLINNKRYVRWTNFSPYEIPYMSTMDAFWEDAWAVSNPDEINTWRILDAPFHGFGNKAMGIFLANYSPAQNQRDELISPVISLQGAILPTCDFDLSYQRRSAISSHQDSLVVLVQFGCDGQRDTLGILTASEMAFTSTYFPNHIPDSDTDWKKFEFSLEAFEGQDIQFVIQSINRNGNNIFIDNFRVFDFNNPPLSLESQQEIEVSIAPNPSDGKFGILIKNVQLYQPYQAIVRNLLGQTVLHVQENTNSLELDLSEFENGVYLVQLDISGGQYLFKIIKE